MPEPTVEQVLNLDVAKPVSKPSVVGPIVAFFSLPPLGVWLLWKERTFHSTFTILSLISASFYLISTLGLVLLGKDLLLVLISLLLCMGQLAISIYYYKKAKSRGYLETNELIILTLFVLLVDLVILPIFSTVIFFELLKPAFQEVINNQKEINSFPLQY